MAWGFKPGSASEFEFGQVYLLLLLFVPLSHSPLIICHLSNVECQKCPIRL